MTWIQKDCKEETAQVNCRICLKSAYLYEHFGLCLFANRKAHTNQLNSDKFCSSLPVRADMLAVPAPERPMSPRPGTQVGAIEMLGLPTSEHGEAMNNFKID